MKKRWKILGGLFAVALIAAIAPIVYVETSCGGPVDGIETDGYEQRVSGEGTRPEGRTWLTYPEWHIVYAADSYGRHLAARKRPSRSWLTSARFGAASASSIESPAKPTPQPRPKR